MGAVTYVSLRNIESLDTLREVQGLTLRSRGGDDLIFPLDGKAVRSLSSGVAARMVRKTSSAHVAIAHERSVAGFGLVSIMQAGRWKYSDMPAYYIRGMKHPESAVAELHRMLGSGGHRVRQCSSGYDVLSNYGWVRFRRWRQATLPRAVISRWQ